MAESSSLANLSFAAEIECPVCLFTLEDPIMLPCGHSFCRKCAKGLIEGETLRCPSCRQNHRLSPDDLRTNFLLRQIIEKVATGGPLEQRAPAPSTAPALLIAAPSDEMFCKSCFFPVRKLNPIHAECEQVSMQKGNRLVQQWEDATVCSESQPKILGDRVCKSNKENIKKKQATMRRLQAEVNKAADETIDLVNEKRESLNKQIEENYSADIGKLQRHSFEIQKKIKTFEVFAPDRTENLVKRISKLKAAELALEEFQLPNLEPLEAELLEFKRNILTLENFSFGELLPGGSESFQDKQDFFRCQLRQLHRKQPRRDVSLKVSRRQLLQSSMKSCKNFSTGDWFKRFEVSFQGEQGVDWGGLSREWFELITSELFSAAAAGGCGLFRRLHDSAQAVVHPNEHRAQHLKLKHYEFAGRVVGKCLYESALGSAHQQYVKARFSRSFLTRIIGLRVSYKNFEVDDPEFYTTKVRYIEENSIDDMDFYFTEEKYLKGKFELVDLVPNGSKKKVTDANKPQYLDALAQHKLVRSVATEMRHFLKGLNEIVPENLLSIFNECELQLLMCGTDSYSIAQFKEHHLIEGTSLEFLKVLDWFWTIVSSFTQAELAQLLQFTTGSSLLPPGGFEELSPKFAIMAVPSYKTLPVSHTW